MISTNEFKTGVTIELDGSAWVIVDFQHVKPGKGAAFVRAKVKNLQTGQVLERTFRAGEKMPKAHVDRKSMQYLYSAGDEFAFMDNETYEQVTLTRNVLEDSLPYMKENDSVTLTFYQGMVIGVDLPIAVELEVKETPPDVRGDTSSGGTKPAVMETGLVVNVPFFIKEGDILKIDTRTGEYLTRA